MTLELFPVERPTPEAIVADAIKGLPLMTRQDVVEAVARAIARATVEAAEPEKVGRLSDAAIEALVENLAVKFFPEARAAITAYEATRNQEVVESNLTASTDDVVRLIRKRANQRPSDAMMSRQNLDETHVIYGQAVLSAVADEVEKALSAVGGREVERLSTLLEEARGVMERVEPHLDAIICYASTTEEHEPNRIAKDFRSLLSRISEVVPK